MSTTNPFLFGVIVSGKDFCNREDEINELKRDIQNGQNTIIYSPRRYGKTSLIFEVFRQLSDEKNLNTVYVNLYSILSETDFVETYHRALFKSLAKSPQTVFKLLSQYLKSIRPKVTVNPDGAFDLGIDFMPEIDEALTDIMDVPLRYAGKTGKNITIAFDEFQQISCIQNRSLEKKIRNIIQEQSNKISYIFLGSKHHIMEEMFSNPNRPFYRAGKHLPLKKIDRRNMTDFVVEKFNKSEKSIPKNLAEHIIDLVDNHPYYVQHYSHVIWDISEKKVNKENLERALNYTLSRESAVFLEIWDRLRLNQKKTLVALALKDKNEGIFSQAILKHFSLPPVSSLQKSLKALYNQELIEKADGDYRIVDLFFKLWIKTSWG